MKTRLAVLSIIICATAITGLSQSGNAVDQQKLKDAATKGFQLQAGSAVPASVHVQAVLIPARICSRLFGKEISNQYAAVELVVSNKNPEAEFLVHSVFLDYSDWLFHLPGSAKRTVDFEASTLNNQIASIEYRIARGEAQDAQLWSSRNWMMRTLTLLGVIATGSEFAFKEQNITKASGAFTGQVVPAAQTFWPDGAGPQLDRISDFGFRTNKVIAKASADIIVAFFPLDRFVTPGLKKIFLKSPAVFFLPQLGKLDKTVEQVVNDAVSKLKTSDSSLKDEDILNGISMNRIHIIVGGTMTMDVDSIPARIDSVTFDDSTDWTKAGTAKGVIQGALLSNGKPTVAESGYNPAAVQDGSTDSELNFTMTIPESGAQGCTLHFTVTKTTDSKTVKSNQYSYTVKDSTGKGCPAPAAPQAQDKKQ
jgi:hypothetical protein